MLITRPPTHEVVNQVPPLAGHDVADDEALLTAVTAYGADWVLSELRELGVLAGSAQTAELARLANVHSPILRTHDRYGHRIDEVEFHPAWHQLMETAVSHGLHATPWGSQRPGGHVGRAAKFFVWTQAEAGHGCPISMTYSVVPALRHAPELAASYEPLLTSQIYEPGLRLGKAGLLAGMAMTEKQGGSDVRANTTRAEPAGDGSYVITGHKWFCSAPMCDLFLILAQTSGRAGGAQSQRRAGGAQSQRRAGGAQSQRRAGGAQSQRRAGGAQSQRRAGGAQSQQGLSCFLLPRVLPDGSRNAMRLQRLKDKLGNRSNASAEVEYDEAVAWPVGEPGRGVPTIIEMVSSTRLDCILGSAANIRQACVEAAHHASHRQAFGALLADQPAMMAVLADLALESEAATTLAIRLASAADLAARGDAAQAGLLRLLLPAAKHWICKRTPAVIGEALECLGGNGFIEESVMPRLYRDAPLNSIWEGSGNVTALDLLRAIARSPASLDALRTELSLSTGADRRLDQAIERLWTEIGEVAAGDQVAAQLHARRLAGLLTVVTQAALLVRHAPAVVSDAFCASRLDDFGGFGGPGVSFGMLPRGLDLARLLPRITPGGTG